MFVDVYSLVHWRKDHSLARLGPARLVFTKENGFALSKEAYHIFSSGFFTFSYIFLKKTTWKRHKTRKTALASTSDT
jgi:hypothetical protein